MNRERAFERLFAYQDRVREEIDRAEALFTLEPDLACPLLAKMRWEMVRLLREYQLFKHTEIYDPIIASASRRPAAIARDMKARCIAAGDRYAAHVKQWSMADVAAEWSAYRIDFRTMAAEIREHITTERAGTQAILAGRERTRSEPAANAG